MKKLILWLALLGIGFLAGFIWQYTQARQARSQLATANQQLSSCQLSNRLAELRNEAALTYVQASEKNYGLAAGHSSRFYDQARQLADQTSDPALRNSLQNLLATRDTITSELAKGDPQVLPQLQDLVMKSEQELKR